MTALDILTNDKGAAKWIFQLFLNQKVYCFIRAPMFRLTCFSLKVTDEDQWGKF